MYGIFFDIAMHVAINYVSIVIAIVGKFSYALTYTANCLFTYTLAMLYIG